MAVYENYDVRVMSALGEFITLLKVKVELKEWMEEKNGKALKKRSYSGLTITVTAETIQKLSAIALTAGAWVDFPVIDFVTVDCSPAGEIPFVILLESVKLLGMTFPDVDKEAAAELTFELKATVGETFINGARINRKKSNIGI